MKTQRGRPTNGKGSKNTNASNSLSNIVLPPITKEKVVHIPKPQVIEHVVEIPHVQHVELIEEVPVSKTVTRWVPTPKINVTERTIEIPRPIIETKVVEVPQIEVIEKIVEVPQYIYEEKLIEVPKIILQERIIPVPKRIIEEKIVEVSEDEYEEILRSTERKKPSIHEIGKRPIQRLTEIGDEYEEASDYKERRRGNEKLPMSGEIYVDDMYRPQDYVETRVAPPSLVPPLPPQGVPLAGAYGVEPMVYGHELGVPPLRGVSPERQQFIDPEGRPVHPGFFSTYHPCYYPSPVGPPPPLGPSPPFGRPFISEAYPLEAYPVHQPVYRHIQRPVPVEIPHYRPVPVERIVDTQVPVPVELEVEEEILYPRVNPKYVRVPVKVPYHTGTHIPWQYVGETPPYLGPLPGVPPLAFPVSGVRYVRNKPKVRQRYSSSIKF